MIDQVVEVCVLVALCFTWRIYETKLRKRIDWRDAKASAFDSILAWLEQHDDDGDESLCMVLRIAEARYEAAKRRMGILPTIDDEAKR